MAIAMMTVTIRKKSDFRDIRADLKARIESLEEMSKLEQRQFEEKQEKAAAEHRKSMDSFKIALTNYRSMLALEEALAGHRMFQDEAKPPGGIGPVQEEFKIAMPTTRIALSDFLLGQIETKGPMSKEALRKAASDAGYFDVGDSGGRAVHATLFNFIRNKRLTVGLSGEYAIPAATLERKS